MAISSIAIDKVYVYSLDAGVIKRTKLGTTKNVDFYDPPTHGSALKQLMTTNEWLFTLHDDGAVFRSYTPGSDEDSSWQAYDVPPNTTYLSSNDTSIFTLSNGRIHRRSIHTGTFTELDNSAQLPNIEMIDSDEEYNYAMANGLIYMNKFPSGAWQLYPEPMTDVLEVTAGIDFVYATKTDGTVYRSMVKGYSGWSLMSGLPGVITTAIPSDHRDALFISDGTTINIKEPHNWYDKPVIDGWIVADWITADFIIVAA